MPHQILTSYGLHINDEHLLLAGTGAALLQSLLFCAHLLRGQRRAQGADFSDLVMQDIHGSRKASVFAPNYSHKSRTKAERLHTQPTLDWDDYGETVRTWAATSAVEATRKLRALLEVTLKAKSEANKKSESAHCA